MKKHNKAIFKAICKAVDIKSHTHVAGTPIEVSKEKFYEIIPGVYRYFIRHKKAHLEIGGGKYSYSDADLKRLAIAYVIKFGLYFKEDASKNKNED